MDNNIMLKNHLWSLEVQEISPENLFLLIVLPLALPLPIQNQQEKKKIHQSIQQHKLDNIKYSLSTAFDQ